MLALRLPPDVEKRLDRLAKKTGRSKSFYAREAIIRHLDDIEDAYTARARVERKTRHVPLEQPEAEVLDDPFAVFSEWAGEEDDKAYAGL
jgi:RHH-type transcriptional regulator, rel operon repressor / antitoxin RelB